MLGSPGKCGRRPRGGSHGEWQCQGSLEQGEGWERAIRKAGKMRGRSGPCTDLPRYWLSFLPNRRGSETPYPRGGNRDRYSGL